MDAAPVIPLPLEAVAYNGVVLHPGDLVRFVYHGDSHTVRMMSVHYGRMRARAGDAEWVFQAWDPAADELCSFALRDMKDLARLEEVPA